MNTRAQEFIEELRRTGLQETTTKNDSYIEFKITDDKVIRVHSNEEAVLIAFVLMNPIEKYTKITFGAVLNGSDLSRRTTYNLEPDIATIYISIIDNFTETLERFINYQDASPSTLVNTSILLNDYNNPSYERLLESMYIFPG